MNANSKREIRMSQIHDPARFDCALPSPVELAAIFDEGRRNEFNFSRTIRRVETIVNFKDEFGFGLRPDWNECAYPEEIWESHERIKAKGK